jgi:hypothetical protein
MRVLRRIGLFAAAFQLALGAQTYSAASNLDPVELEIIEWSRPRDPGLLYLLDLQWTFKADEFVRRALLLGRCDKKSVFSGSNRLSNDAYRALVADGVSILKEAQSKWSPEERVLNDPSLIAAVFTYRNADGESRRDWLSYMRTPHAAIGRDWLVKFDELPEFGVVIGQDIPSGWYHTAWLHWLAEYLRKGGMFDQFVVAADQVEPGLDKVFVTFVSGPTPTATIEGTPFFQLSQKMSVKLPDIVEAVVKGFAPTQVGEVIKRWYNDPWVRRVSATAEQVAAIRDGRSSNLEIQAFLRELGRDTPTPKQRLDDVWSRVKTMTAGRCADLSPK